MTTTTFDDARGLAVTAASAEAVQALDHAVTGYLSMARDTGDRLKAALTADPGMPMGHILKGYFFMLMATRPLHQRAAEAVDQALLSISDMTPRERGHLSALTAWNLGQASQALELWEGILFAHPTDVLALRLAHHGYFYSGDGQNLRDTVSRVLHAWDADVPGYGFVLGMRAFGCEETHDYDTCHEAGREAVGLIPENPWAVHAVAHAYEMTDQPQAGIEWITHNEPNWTGANNFRNHVWWHRALLHLDLGDYGAALELYDREILNRDLVEYLDIINDVALLTRLELHGQDVGDRWRSLANLCRERAGDHQLAFMDAHVAAGLVADGDMNEAEATVEALRAAAAAADPAHENQAVTRDVAADAALALAAWRGGDMARVVDLLMPLRYRLHAMGGSHAQRDLWAMVLLDAVIRTGDRVRAHALAAERLCRTPNDAWTQTQFDRAMAV